MVIAAGGTVCVLLLVEEDRSVLGGIVGLFTLFERFVDCTGGFGVVLLATVVDAGGGVNRLGPHTLGVNLTVVSSGILVLGGSWSYLLYSVVVSSTTTTRPSKNGNCWLSWLWLN